MEEAKESCTLQPVETTAALGSGSTARPLLPQPWASAPPLLLGSGPSPFEATRQPSSGPPKAEDLRPTLLTDKKGKRPVISGRALFAIDPSLFIDDDAAGEDALEREASDDDDEGGERKAVDFTPLSGPSEAEHAAMMAEAQAERDAAEALAAKEKAAAKEAEFAAEAAAFAAAKAAKAKEQEEQASSAPAKGHAEAGASLPAPEAESPPDLAAADLDGVDESLFLGEDFDDVDIE